ncbi:fibrobacter succinogenes major paralogous domain-containing protein [Dysgonomonas sp. Marseille-P4677]|uniref:fibrobacter succinogenes major paralogous domain-containing protein n=1 Tax=Dysgonomonas sp. Marseille-P4677 TaxID=2364790 RepID=UPI001A36B981|nr:fibrobacter succinogenes major paralogous domain-containing protein [Dysgonomonas sp. Marseille-P4677]MBK5722621.1 fibrobacter succinogenes major paralogous domain-containing protein [Dysgonomonas sp. Marseille-P4677]
MFFVSYLVTLNAQVTIGSGSKTNVGALLDLKMNDSIRANSSKGLGLPRVELKNIRTEKDLGKTLGAAADNTLNAKDHIGLIVYNTGSNVESEENRFCQGVHVWDGAQWNPLVPYPAVRIQKGPLTSYKRSFEYLDTAVPDGWPKDKQLARANGYYNLGRNVPMSGISPNGTDNISDQRIGESTPNIYTVSRFYVGYKIIEQEYKIKKSFSCSVELDWDTVAEQPDVLIDTTRIFDEGVWMTQNLRTTVLNNGTALIKRTVEYHAEEYNTVPQYCVPGISSTTPNPAINENTGVLYNWAAAVAVGTPNGLSTIPSVNLQIDEGNSRHRDITYQGICPSGWYLPSNQEWVDLVNGITEKVSSSSTSMFAGQLAGVATKIGYDTNLTSNSAVGVGGYVGQAMKTTTSVLSTASGGRSNTRALSGFDAYLGGSSTLASNNTISHYNNGTAAYFWTSSLAPQFSTSDASRIYVYHTWLLAGTTAGENNFYQGYHNLRQTFSVRCKKETL